MVITRIKPRYFGISLLVFNTIGKCKILVFATCKKRQEFSYRIFPRFLPVLYTGWIFKIVKNRYTTSITQGGAVN